jgi:hypothetical protein
MSNARMPMPAALASMLMPTYGWLAPTVSAMAYDTQKVLLLYKIIMLLPISNPSSRSRQIIKQVTHKTVSQEFDFFPFEIFAYISIGNLCCCSRTSKKSKMEGKS